MKLRTARNCPRPGSAAASSAPCWALHCALCPGDKATTREATHFRHFWEGSNMPTLTATDTMRAAVADPAARGAATTRPRSARPHQPRGQGNQMHGRARRRRAGDGRAQRITRDVARHRRRPHRHRLCQCEELSQGARGDRRARARADRGRAAGQIHPRRRARPHPRGPDLGTNQRRAAKKRRRKRLSDACCRRRAVAKGLPYASAALRQCVCRT